jgi:protein-S-isoprenylcysteine O-methyltransferase Ste14
MDAPWYLRLFYMPILNFIISALLSVIIKAKRMGYPEITRSMRFIYFLILIGGCVLMWFVPFRINLAFWIGLGIIIFGQVIFGLGYSAMREHPEKQKVVVDWGIYGVSRHSHILAGMITLLGVIVMGWNTKSIMYIVLWGYFILQITVSHLGVLHEEKRNIEKFGQEYKDYMKKVPRYFSIFSTKQ